MIIFHYDALLLLLLLDLLFPLFQIFLSLPKRKIVSQFGADLCYSQIHLLVFFHIRIKHFGMYLIEDKTKKWQCWLCASLTHYSVIRALLNLT